MIGGFVLLAAAIWSAEQSLERAPPTAQELGYPKGCTILYGGTGGIHPIKVDCPKPDLSEFGRDLARKAACAGGPTKVKAGRKGLNPDDYDCLPLPPSETLEALGLVAVDITEPDEVTKRRASFERGIRANGNSIQLHDCRFVVMLTAGRGDANKSYGAVCQAFLGAAKPERLMICNDEIVGHFNSASQLPANREAIIKFVKQHCIGG